MCMRLRDCPAAAAAGKVKRMKAQRERDSALRPPKHTQEDQGCGDGKDGCGYSSSRSACPLSSTEHESNSTQPRPVKGPHCLVPCSSRHTRRRNAPAPSSEQGLCLELHTLIHSAGVASHLLPLHWLPRSASPWRWRRLSTSRQ